MLSIYERLNKGEVLAKHELAECYSVSEKTIQRDIDDLRAYLAEEHQFERDAAVCYDRRKQGYYLVRYEREWLTNEEVLSLAKILLESRALNKMELKQLMDKLLLQVVPNDRKIVEEIIKSEYACYVPLQHGKPLLSSLWELSQIINAKDVISFDYMRMDGTERNHIVNPVAIMFSEFYFYLIAFMANSSKHSPTVFRVDRIANMKRTGEKFVVPYSERFSDGEFRKRIQFMYSGELRRLTFEFSGPSIEAVLDRLPTAEILSKANGKYVVRVETYGSGIDMWIRSQGDNIRVIKEANV
jgi:predicted DNA-binding transcriptional regulator YafY